MRAILFRLAVVMLAALGHAGAVENIASSTYNLKPPTDADIPAWSKGWAQPVVQPEGFTTTTGWNYVGSMNGNSATYLGQGWVLTAAHIVVGDLNLGGKRYPVVAHSAQRLGFSDLLLVQVSPHPDLPSLPLRFIPPVPGTSLLIMLGFGGPGTNRDLSWGLGVVTEIGQRFSLPSNNATSTDLVVVTGTNQDAASGLTNHFRLVVGDSGGPGFIWSPGQKRWELAAIAEYSDAVTRPDHTFRPASGFIQLDSYAALIDQIARR